MPLAFHTRVDFQPLSHEERDHYLRVEKAIHQERLVVLERDAATWRERRQKRYDEIKGEFPECGRQRHCQSNLSRGSVERFERYNELLRSLQAIEVDLVEAEGKLIDWNYRYQLRARAIHNRFLAKLLTRAPEQQRGLRSVMVHSLESFSTRREISERLLRLNSEDMAATQVGDLDFRVHNKPVDEAAVIATYEIRVVPNAEFPEAPNRYLLTVLIHSQESEAFTYDIGLLQAWGRPLVEPEQKQLKQSVFCGLYSIASSSLIWKFSASKMKHCPAFRTQMQRTVGVGEQLDPSTWILPLSFVALK